ncbi:MAG TPA: hypothetical protein VJ501_13780 [Burkholderiaceae bacterium]|nr:hypothetical protein [Burkholderiaceae bacterium]
MIEVAAVADGSRPAGHAGCTDPTKSGTGQTLMNLLELLVWLALGGAFGWVAGLSLRSGQTRMLAPYVAVGIFAALTFFGGSLESPFVGHAAAAANGISVGGLLVLTGLAGALLVVVRRRARDDQSG